MTAYEKICAALEWGEGPIFIEALAALAELERAAAEPSRWECEYANGNDETMVDMLPFSPEDPSFYDKITPLYAAPLAPLAPVAEIREPTRIDDAMVKRVLARIFDALPLDSADEAHTWLAAWCAELGPTLGLVEIRKPTPEECRNIWREAKANEGDGSKVCAGRAMFDACRAVLWPKEGL